MLKVDFAHVGQIILVVGVAYFSTPIAAHSLCCAAQAQEAGASGGASGSSGNADFIACKESGAPDSAIPACTKLITDGDLPPERLAQAHYYRAIDFDAKGQRQEEEADYKAAIDIAPLSPAAAWSLCNRAVNRMNDADWQAAFIDLNESIRILPDYALSYANRSRVWRAKGDTAKALDDANQAISLDAKSGFAHQQLGLILSDKEDWKSAVAEFSKAIDSGYSRSSVYHNRALAESTLGNHDAAIEDYTTAIRLAPSASSLEARGREYETRKQFDLAKADYTEAIRVDPKYQKAYFSRAALLVNHFNQDDDSLADYTELLRLDGKNQDARIERANIYVNTHRFALALADLDEALAGKADTPSKIARAHALRALAYIEKGNNDAAKQDADAAVERDPLSAIAYQARGRAVVAWQQAELEQCPRQRSPAKMYAGVQMSPVCQSGPQYDGAIRDFDEAIRLNPQAAANYYWRASAYEDLEKLDHALADYSAAIRLKPSAANGYLGRGRVYHRKRQFDAAIVDYS